MEKEIVGVIDLLRWSRVSDNAEEAKEEEWERDGMIIAGFTLYIVCM